MNEQPTTQSAEGGDPQKALAEAKARARVAEAEAKALRESTKKRETAEQEAKRQAEINDLQSAKAELERYREQEKKAREEAEQYRTVIASGIERKLQALPEETQARLRKYETKLSMADWAEMIDEEGGRTDITSLPEVGTESSTGIPPPPAVTTSSIRRLTDTRGEGRPLHPKTVEILKGMGQDMTGARKGLERIGDDTGTKAIFTFPPQKLKTMIRERAIQPKMLSQEGLNKLFE